MLHAYIEYTYTHTHTHTGLLYISRTSHIIHNIISLLLLYLTMHCLLHVKAHYSPTLQYWWVQFLKLEKNFVNMVSIFRIVLST